MQKYISKRIPPDTLEVEQGIARLLEDLEKEFYLKSDLISSLISLKDSSKLNESHANFFLSLYTDAHTSHRHEFTMQPNDEGRLSWINFIVNQLIIQYGTFEVNLSQIEKERIFVDFRAYAQNFSKKWVIILPEINIIMKNTKRAFEWIIKK